MHSGRLTTLVAPAASHPAPPRIQSRSPRTGAAVPRSERLLLTAGLAGTLGRRRRLLGIRRLGVCLLGGRHAPSLPLGKLAAGFCASRGVPPYRREADRCRIQRSCVGSGGKGSFAHGSAERCLGWVSVHAAKARWEADASPAAISRRGTRVAATRAGLPKTGRWLRDQAWAAPHACLRGASGPCGNWDDGRGCVQPEAGNGGLQLLGHLRQPLRRPRDLLRPGVEFLARSTHLLRRSRRLL